MKMFFLNLVLCVFLCQCAYVQKQKVASSEATCTSPPQHTGNAYAGSYGLYTYDVYLKSVAFHATSPDVLISEAHVYDTNNDLKYDSVYIFKNGQWFHSTIKDSQSGENSEILNYIALANFARRSIEDNGPYPNQEIQNMFSFKTRIYSNIE